MPFRLASIWSRKRIFLALNDLCDLICSFLPINYEDKKKYITLLSPIKRAKYLIEDMQHDLKFVELEQKIEAEVDKELNDTQKEYFLREKIKAMQKELGEANSKDDEVELFSKKISKLKCNNKVKDKIKRELNRYSSLNSNSPEVGMIREYLEWMIHLPWNHYTKDTSDLVKVKGILDSSHYALEEVKDRIEILSSDYKYITRDHYWLGDRKKYRYFLMRGITEILPTIDVNDITIRTNIRDYDDILTKECIENLESGFIERYKIYRKYYKIIRDYFSKCTTKVYDSLKKESPNYFDYMVNTEDER